MAIALDSSSQTTGYSQSSGVTLSHTCAGSNRVLLVFLAMGGATPDTQFTSIAATYNGVSMTNIAGAAVTNANRKVACFRLIAPATGANNIAVTWGGGGTEIRIFGISFTGVDQTNPINTSGTTTGSSGTTLARSLTTTTDNCYMAGMIFVREGGLGNITSSDSTVITQDQTTADSYRSTGAAGAFSITFTVASGSLAGGSAMNAVAIAPAADAATSFPDARIFFI